MNKPIIVLGIHDGHNCGATIVKDGIVEASVSEERLTRRKNEVGYPRKAIEEVLKISNISKSDVNEVVYASLFMHSADYLTDLKPWYKVGIEQQKADESKPKGYEKEIFKKRKEERINQVCDHLNITAEKVNFVEHHLAHVAAAYYTDPDLNIESEKLGLTCDGSGDGICATVNKCKGHDFERIAATDRHASLGKIYSRVTMLMGMKPWEHEYKLMGLSPYAEHGRVRTAAKPLEQLIRLSDDGLTFQKVGELSTNYCYRFLQDTFEEVQFDVIAGAVQLFTEELLVKWVRSCIKETGITDVVLGGGVFMNVKANMLIAQIPELTSLYIMPSCGDESLSIGAGLLQYYQITNETDYQKSSLTNLYLGGTNSIDREEETIKQFLDDDKIEVIENDDIDIKTAELLADGHVVARCRGKMEWGARALGNRSILASAHDYRIVERINSMIKKRDFWMPFAPSIKEESMHLYLENPKNIKAYYMIFAFDSLKKTYSHLEAGSHPRDKTIRPQIVNKNANPDYHKLIDHYEKLTGRGVVLNTSFNLHGYPIVYTARDAIDVLLNSGLEYLALNNFLIRKKFE